MSQPHFEVSVKMRLTLPKVGTWSPLGLPQLQSSIAEAKTPCLEVFFIPLEKALKCRCPKLPHMSHLDICSTSYGQKKGRESNWQFNFWPQKVKNRSDPNVCRWSATNHWKALEESYKFALDLILIRGLSWELWAPKVSGVQTGTISGLLFGSPGNKSHLDAGATEQCKEYYMGEGGGFPRVRAVVSQVSPCCPWLIPTARVFPNVN
jgi:hypothetical protein